VRRAAWLLLAIAVCAEAQIFRWTDAQGKVHYGDRPPADAKAKETGISNIPREAPSSDVEVLPTQIEYFAVSGLSIQDIGQSMRLTAPKGEEGQPVWGQAHWRLRWKFAHDTSKGCRIDKMAITVSSTLRMPQWQDRQRGALELQEKWAAFYRALLVHEEGHRDNGIRAGNDLARRIRGLGSYGDCEALNAQISNLGARITGEYSLVDASYDRTTQHGVTQGATLR
jgi:predicted secreted Zn-dependent protease